MTTDTATEPSLRITVRPISSSRDYKRFIDFQYRLYKDYPRWVPLLRSEVAKSLNPRKNAFFEHGRLQAFVAEDEEGRIVGRVAAIINGMHLKKYEDQTGFFGFFECENVYDIARELLDAATAWLKEQGMVSMRGPVNPSMNDISGLLVDGFDKEPSIMMPYNPPYYFDFLSRYGFERAMTMWAYFIHYKYINEKKLTRAAALFKRRHPGVTMRTLNMDRFEEETRLVLDIYNEAWHDNWGHVPMTEKEIEQLAKELKQIIDPNIVFILEDEGVPFAFSVSLPNINVVLKHIDDGRLFPTGLPHLLLRLKFGEITEARTLLMGIRDAYKSRGLDMLLHLAALEYFPKNGYHCSEMSWVLDSNTMMKNTAVNIGGLQDKEYVMLEKAI